MTRRKTIFLVDDDEDDRLLFSEGLKKAIEDVEVVEFENGAELMALLNHPDAFVEPALVMTDMNMPKVSGFDLLTAIKKGARTSHIPVLMVSTASSNEFVAKAYSLGVNAFMVKPVTPHDYESMAVAVNVCFFNAPTDTTILPAPRMHSAGSVIIIEDNDDHWTLMNLSLRLSLPNVNLIRLADKNDVSDFLHNRYHTLNPLPEMIFLDLYLPSRSDGFEVLQQIRLFIERNKLPEIPIIMFSHSNHHEDIRASYGRSANAYLVKPSDGKNWPNHFRHLSHLWLKTFRIPQRH